MTTTPPPGQFTVVFYLQLDRVQPWEITGMARVLANVTGWVFWYIGIHDECLVRTDLDMRQHAKYPQALQERCDHLLHLPCMRLLGDDAEPVTDLSVYEKP